MEFLFSIQLVNCIAFATALSLETLVDSASVSCILLGNFTLSTCSGNGFKNTVFCPHIYSILGSGLPLISLNLYFFVHTW
jgi:hypothetical protein